VLALAEDGDVLLAYEMNGAPLPADHGFPVRVVVPGYAGVRHVKWLKSITVSAHDSPLPWHQTDYRRVAAGATPEDYARAEPIYVRRHMCVYEDRVCPHYSFPYTRRRCRCSRR
jgi:sulfite oxidase